MAASRTLKEVSRAVVVESSIKILGFREVRHQRQEQHSRDFWGQFLRSLMPKASGNQ